MKEMEKKVRSKKTILDELSELEGYTNFTQGSTIAIAEVLLDIRNILDHLRDITILKNMWARAKENNIGKNVKT